MRNKIRLELASQTIEVELPNPELGVATTYDFRTDVKHMYSGKKYTYRQLTQGNEPHKVIKLNIDNIKAITFIALKNLMVSYLNLVNTGKNLIYTDWNGNDYPVHIPSQNLDSIVNARVHPRQDAHTINIDLHIIDPNVFDVDTLSAVRTISGQTVTIGYKNLFGGSTIVETLPVGLLPYNHNGTWNPTNRTLTWFVYNPNGQISYFVNAANDTYTISGTIAFGSALASTTGDTDVTTSIGVATCSRTIYDNGTPWVHVYLAADLKGITNAYQIFEDLGAGASPLTISDGGVWDANTRRITWTFYDNVDRTVSYTLRGLTTGDYSLGGYIFDGVYTGTTSGATTFNIQTPDTGTTPYFYFPLVLGEIFKSINFWQFDRAWVSSSTINYDGTIGNAGGDNIRSDWPNVDIAQTNNPVVSTSGHIVLNFDQYDYLNFTFWVKAGGSKKIKIRYATPFFSVRLGVYAGTSKPLVGLDYEGFQPVVYTQIIPATVAWADAGDWAKATYQIWEQEALLNLSTGLNYIAIRNETTIQGDSIVIDYIGFE